MNHTYLTLFFANLISSVHTLFSHLITPVDSNSKNVLSYNLVNAIEDVLNANQVGQQPPTLIVNLISPVQTLFSHLITPVDSNSENVLSYNLVNAIEDVINANQIDQQLPTLIANLISPVQTLFSHLITPVDSNPENVLSYNFVNAIEDVINVNQIGQQPPALIANLISPVQTLFSHLITPVDSNSRPYISYRNEHVCPNLP